jgi:uncharacterized protein
MKESFYNYYVDIGLENKILLYNSLADSYLVLSRKSYDIFIDSLENINSLKNKDGELFKLLKSNGFIASNNKNEKKSYLEFVREKKMSKKFYHLIINPTLDCNLKCWYCYENHIHHSKMSEKIIKTISNHIRQKQEEDKFSEFLISFFGGEPFLRFENIKNLLYNIKMISLDMNFKMYVNFTTNGTLINEEKIDFLKEYHPSFQITLDGNKDQHNKVRVPKNKRPTYENIIQTITLLSNNAEISHVNIRINFSEETLEGLHLILYDLADCNKSKIEIRLYRIWQINSNSINDNKVLQFIKIAQSKLFKVIYLPLEYNTCACYADSYNEAVINYDGNVFKCTARDFTEENAEGVLLEDGTIKWDMDKLNRRMSVQIQEFCLDCKLLPSCAKICSQNLMERGSDIGCIIKRGLTAADYIIHNFNNKLIASHEQGTINNEPAM